MIDLTRTALFAHLAERSPNQWIGRTALMKFCYFLQTLKDVPLGYSFTLYSYGPFDSSVLSDLGEAEALGIIEEMPDATGYGYKIRSTVSNEDLNELAGSFLVDHKTEIDWVMEEFGARSAADLELDSTIVYIDREASDAGVNISEQQLVQQVCYVKPHFTEAKVRKHVQALNEKRLLLGLEPE